MFSRLVLFGLLSMALSSHGATLFSTNSTWRFLRGTNEASLPDTTLWRTNTFTDSNFANASSPFWYGDARPGGTTLSDMQNNYSCIFLRRTFVVPDAAAVSALRMQFFIDDGFVAWINGVEVLRVNMPEGPVTRTTLASNQPIDPAPLETTNLFPVSTYLRTGENLIAIQAFNTSLGGSSDFGFDCSLETLSSETVPPTIVSVDPPPGDVTTLTQITVTFSEPVIGVSADDFLLNTQPASSVSGSGATYTFGFAQPLYGNVSITWFADHGITDQALPPNAFDGTGPGATWQYELLDQVPPTVTILFPPAGGLVRSLEQIEVTFSEEVEGVDAADLRVGALAATSVTRNGAGAYVFQFPTPAVGTVQAQWVAGHGITDQAVPANAFAGGSWTYTYDPNAPQGDLIITEVLASNQSGLLDEDGQEEDWIEIYNRGSTPVNLADWALSDDPDLPSLWTFPARTLPAGQYLVVFASGKDRKPLSGPRPHTNFQLGRDPEHLGLYSPDSPRVLVSGFTPYPEQRNDHSYGYDHMGNLRYFATPTPGMPNGASTILAVAEPVHFSVNRGFFTTPFNLVLSTPTPGGFIRYTLDGSEPTLVNGTNYTSPLVINRTTMVRAAAFKNNFLPSRVGTHSYLFNFTPAQRSLPVINVVTATNNFIGRTGIIGMGGGSRAGDGLFITNNPATDYHNPSAHGIAWERPVSAEYILPGDNSGFQIDCGIRVQGSDWQRPRTMPTTKFSFRLYFRGDYGAGKLDYPIFPLSTVQSFDQLVLRAGYNENSNPFIRDELTRRLSHDMGQVASVGSMALVLLNGGPHTNGPAPVYNPCERVHEEMLQAKLGGGPEWDVVGPSFAQSSEGPGIIDGDRNDFNNLLNYVWSQQTATTMTNPSVYTQIARRLDVVNFADYCLLNAYAAMGDWPANNWRAARERGNTNALWRFIAWDAEWGEGFSDHTFTTDSFVLSGTGTLDAGLNSTGNSEIARLYQRLRANREFRLLWADRIHKHFFNGGALSSQSVSNRIQELRNELLLYFTITDSELLNWPGQRLPPLFTQFNTQGLYGYSNALYGVFASSNAPAYNQHGGRVAPGFMLTMTAPLGGQIYYTLNGADPRVPFTGAVSNSASLYSSPVALNQSAVVKARTLLNGTNWSALAEADFNVAGLGVPLRITEIMYNPIGGSLFEFIEIQNVGGFALNLGGMTLSGEIDFTIPVGTVLAPGARLVLGNNTDPSQFAARYGAGVAAGFFSGNLDNGGGRITLSTATGQTILTVDYDDEDGWPTAADGAGYSLELANFQAGPDEPTSWRASAAVNGTPGQAAAAPPNPPIVLNELMATNRMAVPNAGTFPDWIELRNPGGSPVNISGWSLSDDGAPGKFIFPNGTSIPAGGFLVVWCDSAATPGLHTGFNLNQDGESVFLFNASSNYVDGVTFGLQLPDYSIGRVNGSWQLTTPTANAANTPAPLAAASNLAINEWLANSHPGQPDWVELYNRDATLPVALQGLYLATSNNVQRVTSLSFIAPNGFALFFADDGVGPDHLDLALPAAAGAIILYDSLAAEIERVTYTAQTEGVSRGRLPDGTSNIVNFPGSASPRASNYSSSYGGAYINEVMARNQSAVTNSAGQVVDWIEFFNPNPTNFSLAGMSLSVDEPDPGQWVIPAGVVVPANGYLLIWCDSSRPASTVLEANLNTGRALNGDSGGVYLFNPAGQLLNSIEYGFQIDDRVIGRIGSTWRLLASATPGAVNSGAATLGNANALRINEWMADPAGGDDWFELYNLTNQPVDLGGLYLADDPSLVGRTNFRAAPLTFIDAGGWVRWIADGNPGNGRDHAGFALDAEGESIQLYTISVTLIDAVSFGRQKRGVSEGRLPDGSAAIVAFPGSATPGEGNYRLIENVVINEVLTHTDPPLEDAIELHNPTASPASIGGWYLSNTQRDLRKYRIPDGAVIPANGYVVFYEFQFNSGAPGSFNLNSAHGDEVWLSTADGAGNLTGFRTGAKFGAALNGVSFGRVVTKLGVEYAAMAQRTFGMDSPSSLAQFRTGAGAANSAPRVGPVVLSEIMYNPSPSLDGRDHEYLELRNLSASPVPLYDPANPANTWRLRDAVEFAFPQNTMLAANAHLLVVNFDPVNDPAALTAFRAHYGLSAGVPIVGPYRGNLGNGGDDVELTLPDTPQMPPAPDAGFVPYVRADRVEYSDGGPWPSGAVDGGGLSLQRRTLTAYGNDPLNWLAGNPTPGANNNSGIVAPPVVMTSPQDQTAIEDARVTFQVAATGTGPLRYQWRLNGAELPGATNNALTIDYVQLDNQGSYDVFVSNAGGSAFSDAANLTVNAPPTIVVPPLSQTVQGGNTATLTVGVRGTAPLSYQWRLNGVTLPGANGDTLIINNADLENAGLYEVTVSNAFGAARTNATLVVLVAPQVLHPLTPINLEVVQGGNVTVSTVVRGTLPMSYRWRRGSATLALLTLTNDTSFFTLTNVQPPATASQTNITVVLTNAANAANPLIRTNATLTVLTDGDGDGIPDNWENAHNLMPGNASDAALDPDGDSLSNLEEYIAGTDPQDPDSYLKIDASHAPDGAVTLSFIAVAGRSYTILSRDAANSGPWQPLTDVVVSGEDRLVEVQDASAEAGTRRFYRLATPKQ